jgi:predicted outer membrane repeat protein/parallel beta-helix repeat protein
MRLSPPFNNTFIAVAIGCALKVSATQAANIEVNSIGDDNGVGCTLREAVSALNDVSILTGTTVNGCSLTGEPRGPNDMISFAAPLFNSMQTITLDSLLPIRADMTVNGTGQNLLVIDGGKNSGVLDILDSTVSLNQLTISGGLASNGSGLYVQGESVVSINNSTFSNNTATDSGGGIYATDDSIVTFSDSTVSVNMASGDGGGIYSDGEALVTLNRSMVTNNVAQSGGGLGAYKSTLVLNQSTVSSNTANESGGGIFIIDSGSELTLSSSTVSNNTATSLTGGGIYAKEYALLNIANSTLSGNSAIAGSGGAIDARYNSTSTVDNSTIIDNSADAGSGGALFVYYTSTINLNNTVVVSSHSGNNCATKNPNPGTINSISNNWFDDLSCNGISSGNPSLGVLQDNGGFTQTHAPLTGSGLLKAGNTTVCTGVKINNIDQLGEARDTPCTIGAVERAPDITTFFTIPTRTGKVAVIAL